MGSVTTLTAQITITSDDMPSAGDTIRKSTGLNIDFADPSETGEDFTWDYSQLLSIVQTVDTFVSVTETPFFYWLFYLANSNLASPVISDSPIPQIPLTDVFQFYNNSSSNFVDNGSAATLFSIPIPLKYDEPDLVYKFPMNYGDEFSSTSGIELGLDNLGFVYIERNRVNTVDGWGTLLTPYGTFDVLRIKSEVTEYDSIFIDSLDIGIPVNIEYIEYKWMGKGQKVPLLQVTDNLLGFVVEYRDSLRTETTSIDQENLRLKVKLNIFPNPTSGLLNIEAIELDKSADLKIYNLNGKQVYSSKIGQAIATKSTFSINLKSIGLKPGQYILQINTGGQKQSKRFVFMP